MKSRVVVLGGAGAMGRIIARDLAATSGGTIEAVVADRDVKAARALELETVGVDVSSPESLARALRGASLVIASLPYRFNIEAMNGALAAKCHYIDLGGLFHVTRRQLRLAADFRRAGLMAVLGVGSSPGITNVLAVLAARDLDVVSEVHCKVGNRDLTRFRHKPPLGFGYSPDTLLDELMLPSAVFRDGRTTFVPALDTREREACRFAMPLGQLVLDTTLHSEIATLPRFFKGRGIREVTFRQSFEPELLDRLKFVVELGLGKTTKLPGLDVAPRAVLAALLRELPPAELEGPRECYEVLRTVVKGEREGRPMRVTAECAAGPDAGLGVGPDIDTGAPPSIVAQLLLATGEMPVRPGVWAPEEVVPPGPFVRELERRGMRVNVTTRATAGRRIAS